jgi:hypothetical protein
MAESPTDGREKVKISDGKLCIMAVGGKAITRRTDTGSFKKYDFEDLVW